MNTIDVYIFTGFLGSGKTTLLNSLLSKIAKTKKIVVIENEIGEVNIDSKLINNLSHYTYELTQGCICCSLSDDLYDILFQIYESNSKPDVVVIETTGIADVGSLRGTELEFVIMVIAVSCVKLLSAHNSTQHTSRKHKV
jgi:Putative GTPases (G3E family)